jgi:CRP-like cAMP-binding protein
MYRMGEEELGSILSTMERRIYDAGDRIVEESRPSDCLIISADGVVDVIKR